MFGSGSETERRELRHYHRFVSWGGGEWLFPAADSFTNFFIHSAHAPASVTLSETVACFTRRDIVNWFFCLSVPVSGQSGIRWRKRFLYGVYLTNSILYFRHTGFRTNRWRRNIDCMPRGGSRKKQQRRGGLIGMESTDRWSNGLGSLNPKCHYEYQEMGGMGGGGGYHCSIRHWYHQIKSHRRP